MWYDLTVLENWKRKMSHDKFSIFATNQNYPEMEKGLGRKSVSFSKLRANTNFTHFFPDPAPFY